METHGSFSAVKDRSGEALGAAKILFPSSSATSPVDNSVQGLLERLRLSAKVEPSESDTKDNEEVLDGHLGDPVDKQDLLRRGAERGLQLLEAVQEWLVLEEQKTELGLASTDCEFTAALFHRGIALI